MRFCIGTMNPGKVRGVELALRDLGIDAEVVPTPVNSGVPPQPIGLGTVVRGARNRALASCREGCDCCVGVEAGFFKLEEGVYVDVQVAAIKCGDRLTYGLSPGFMIPRRFWEPLVAGEAPELEVLVDEWFGTRNIGDKGGLISLVTKGVVDRIHLTRDAVIMAMVPHINEGLYFGEGTDKRF